jgi:hypothetical protein
MRQLVPRHGVDLLYNQAHGMQPTKKNALIVCSTQADGVSSCFQPSILQCLPPLGKFNQPHLPNMLVLFSSRPATDTQHLGDTIATHSHAAMLCGLWTCLQYSGANPLTACKCTATPRMAGQQSRAPRFMPPTCKHCLLCPGSSEEFYHHAGHYINMHQPCSRVREIGLPRAPMNLKRAMPI